MAPSQMNKAVPNQEMSMGRTTKGPGSKTTTKANDTNRVLKPSSSQTSERNIPVKSTTDTYVHIPDDFENTTHSHLTLLRRGPNGPPIYDSQGFELDYHKVLKSMRPVSNRSRRTKTYKNMLERAGAERREIESIVGLPKNEYVGCVRYAVQERVARDLGVMWHQVGILQYREWKGLGFKIDPEEFRVENISEEERKRLLDLSCGSALRK